MSKSFPRRTPVSETIKSRYAKVVIAADILLISFIIFAADYLLEIEYHLGITTILHVANIAAGVVLLRRKGIYLACLITVVYLAFRYYVNDYGLYYVIVQGVVFIVLFYLIHRTVRTLETLNNQTMNDLQELKRKEAIILESQKNFLRLFNSIEDALWLVERDWKIFYVNRSVCRVLKSKRSSFSGSDLDDFFVDPNSSSIKPEFESILKQMKKHAIVKLRNKEHAFNDTFEVRVTEVIWDSRSLYFVICHNISDRIEAQDNLRISEEKFSKAFYLNPSIMIISTLQEGKILDVNQSFLNVIGYNREEVIGKTSTELNLFVDKEERDYFKKTVVEQGRIDNLEINLQANNGKIINGLIHSEQFAFHGTDCLLSVIMDQTDSKRINSDLINQSRILYGLSYTSNYLLTNIDLNKGIETALAIICRSLLCDGVLIYSTKDNGRDEFYLYKSYLANTVVNLSCLVEPTETLILNEAILKELNAGRAITQTNPFADSILFSANKYTSPSSFFVSPIRVHDESWGFSIYVFQCSERSWSKGDEVILLALANSIGGAIQRDDTLKQLTIAKENAIRADKAKSSFLAMMSHEIRTPLNAILGMANLLRNSELDSELIDYVDSIRISGDTLLDLINDILDFSRIESGYLGLDHHNFNLNTCIEDVLELLSVKAAEKNIDLIYLPDFDIKHQIFGDSFRIRQVLLNLVGIAIKFTEKGYVEIRIRTTINETDPLSDEFLVIVDVKDTGIGIDPKTAKSIFQPFAQADSTISHRFGGSGLGLSISLRLALMMGGDIEVISEPGTGSTFSFSFLTHIIPEQTLPVFDYSCIMGKKVFLQNSNPQIINILSNILDTNGIKTKTIIDFQDILVALSSGSIFDLGIVECYESAKDSSDQLYNLRSIPEYSKIPILFIRTIGKKALSFDQQKNPLNHFINKPIKPFEFLDQIASILTGSSKEQAKSKSELFDINTAINYPHDILIAEDNKINQKLLKTVLVKNGYEPDIVMTGQEVIDAVKRRFYDIILMDFFMPGMNGLDASSTIRKLNLKKQPTIIAMTANASDEDRKTAFASGMNHFLTKPLNFQDLLEILKQPI